jgi:hypothetical protein
MKNIKIVLSKEKALVHFSNFARLYGELTVREHGNFRHCSLDYPITYMDRHDLVFGIGMMFNKFEELFNVENPHKCTQSVESTLWSRFKEEFGECKDRVIYVIDGARGEWLPKHVVAIK